MIRDDGFDAEDITPVWVMYYAFGIGMDRRPERFSGLPAWASSEYFDVVAKVADADIRTWKQMGSAAKERMVLAVLQDRFKLSFHIELHEEALYALVVARGGPALKQVASPAPDSMWGEDGSVLRSATGAVGNRVTMRALTDYLNQLRFDREIVDKTGLAGNYDFEINFTPYPPGIGTKGMPVVAGSAYPSIFTALQDDLGLKLEATRGPVQTIAIDHFERPSAN